VLALFFTLDSLVSRNKPNMTRTSGHYFHPPPFPLIGFPFPLPTQPNTLAPNTVVSQAQHLHENYKFLSHFPITFDSFFFVPPHHEVMHFLLSVGGRQQRLIGPLPWNSPPFCRGSVDIPCQMVFHSVKECSLINQPGFFLVGVRPPLFPLRSALWLLVLTPLSVTPFDFFPLIWKSNTTAFLNSFASF